MERYVKGPFAASADVRCSKDWRTRMRVLKAGQSAGAVPEQFAACDQHHSIHQRIEDRGLQEVHETGAGKRRNQGDRQQGGRQAQIGRIQFAESKIGDDLDRVQDREEARGCISFLPGS